MEKEAADLLETAKRAANVEFKKVKNMTPIRESYVLDVVVEGIFSGLNEMIEKLPAKEQAKAMTRFNHRLLEKLSVFRDICLPRLPEDD